MMLVFALAAPAMATAGDYNAYYVQNASGSYPDFSSTGSGTIYLTILSNKVSNKYIARYNLPIAITAGDHDEDGDPDYCTAYEALIAADNDNTNYPYLSFRWGYYPDVPLGASYALTGIKDTTVDSSNYFGISLSPLDLGKVGYMFRINDKFPILANADYPSGWNTTTQGLSGADLAHAYVQDGDHITVYFADADNANDATEYIKIDTINRTGTSIVKITMSSHATYYGPAYDYYWNLPASFSTLTSSGFSAKVNGSSATVSLVNGVYWLTGVSLHSGTNTVEILPRFHTVASTFENLSGETTSINYVVPEYTSAYGTITI